MHSTLFKFLLEENVQTMHYLNSSRFSPTSGLSLEFLIKYFENYTLYLGVSVYIKCTYMRAVVQHFSSQVLLVLTTFQVPLFLMRFGQSNLYRR